MSGLLQNIRHTVRILIKSPAVTSIAVMSLALGIGANTTIFSIVNALILRPLPVSDPKQLIAIRTMSPGSEGWNDTLSLPTFEAIQRNQRVFSSMFAWGVAMANFEANGLKYAGTLNGVNGDYFSTLGVQPLLGRLITPSDVDLEGGQPAQVAVLDYRCWQQKYNGDPAIVGKTIRISGRQFSIIGVMPSNYAGFVIDAATEVTVPIGEASTHTLRDFKEPWLVVGGRLKRGVSLEQARTQFRLIWPTVQNATIPAGYRGEERAKFFARRIDVQSAEMGTSWMRQRLSRPLVVLMILVGFVLLIACVNLANLMLARAAGRQQEIGIRIALGAGIGRLIQQLLTESLALSIGGATLGVLLSLWLSRFLVNFVWPGFAFAPLALDTGPDLRVLLFTLAITLTTGVLFGLAPARKVTRVSPANALQRNPRTLHSGAGVAGKFLIGAQAALSLVLVFAAVLFARGLSKVSSVDPGFRREGVLVTQLYLQANHENIPNRTAYYRELAERLARLPDVESVTYSHMAPVFAYEYRQATSAPFPSTRTAQAVADVIGPNFFHVMGMHVLTGREFDWRDNETASRVVIVSESLARQLFPSENPIGRTIDVDDSPKHKGMQVVGVVNNASLWMVQSHEPEAVYIPMMQEPSYNQSMVDIRTTGDPWAVAGSMRQTLESMGHHIPLRMQTLEERVNNVLTTEHMVAMLAAFFAGLALLLASIGLYGIVSHSVTRRTPEIGIRIALGAQRGEVIRLILIDTAWPVLTGIVVGVLGALAISPLAASMLFNVSASDPPTLALSVLTLLAVASFAGYLPARRASRIDAMSALRGE